MSALHQKDVYKVGHVFQYPEGTTEVYSNMTARSGALANPNIGGITVDRDGNGSRGIFIKSVRELLPELCEITPSAVIAVA